MAIFDNLTNLTGIRADIASIIQQLNKKLSLTGGTLTGKLTTQNVVPQTAQTYVVGSLGQPYLGTYARNYYLIDSASKDCGKLTLQEDGTASKEGVAGLWLGNSLAKGTDGNSRGQVVLFNSNSNYAYVYANPNMTANAGMVLSSKGGTIPTASVSGATLTINI